MKTVYMCFSTDIIHSGHINIINKASQLGSVVAGVLCDRCVAIYEKYPLLPEQERVIEVLKEWGGELVERPCTSNATLSTISQSLQSRVGMPETRRLWFQYKFRSREITRVMEVHDRLSALLVERTRGGQPRGVRAAGGPGAGPRARLPDGGLHGPRLVHRAGHCSAKAGSAGVVPGRGRGGADAPGSHGGHRGEGTGQPASCGAEQRGPRVRGGNAHGGGQGGSVRHRPGLRVSQGFSVDSPEELAKALEMAKKARQLTFLEVKCALGARDDLGRPTTTP